MVHTVHPIYIINTQKKTHLMKMEEKEKLVRRWVSRLEESSTDRTPSKLEGNAAGLTREDAERVLTAAYTAAMARRGIRRAIDEPTRERLRKASRWLAKREKPSLLLYGHCGVGKTTMLRSLAELLKEGRNFEGIASITATEVYEMFRDEALRYRYDRLKTVQVLLLDDLGCEPERCLIFGTPWEPILDLIYARYERLLPTVITTNLDDDQIRARYGVRMADRLNELYDKITFTGQSYRTK